MPDLVERLLAADPATREKLLREADQADLHAAITALGHRHDPAAAAVLALVDQVVADRVLRKAARKELHRLRSSGIAAPAVASVAPAPAAQAEHSVAVTEAWATDVDPTGSRALWLLGERPLGGAWFAALLLNDLKGVVELSLVDTTRKRFLRELDERRRDQGNWVELPGDYAWRLVREAVDISHEQGTALPNRYRSLREVFGEAPAPPERALVYDTVSPVEVSFNPELIEESRLLVREPEVAGWYVPIPSELRERALAVARGTTSALLVPGQTPDLQALHLLSAVAQEALTPTLRRALQRRLEETAYIFVRTDRLAAARRAVAAAKTLRDTHRDVETQPFLRVLIESGLARALRNEAIGGRPAPEVLLELIEGAVQQARESNRPIESRPSGLILPR
jgi:hypothetical protein